LVGFFGFCTRTAESLRLEIHGEIHLLMKYFVQFRGDLSWRLLNLVLPPFLVSISVYLQLFEKYKIHFVLRGAPPIIPPPIWASLKCLSHTRWCIVISQSTLVSSWNLQRCSVNGSCTLKLD
jgi:hypothetical protein